VALMIDWYPELVPDSLPKFSQLCCGPYSASSPNFMKSAHNYESYSANKQTYGSGSLSSIALLITS